MAEKDVDTSKGRRRPWVTRRRVLLAVLLLLVLLVLVWFVPGPPVPSGPVTWRRGADGRFVRTEQAASAAVFHFSAHATAFDAQDELSSTASTVRTTAARFSARRIAVFCLSEHPLVALASVALAEQLQSLDFTDEVVLYPAGSERTAGGLAPDCVVTIGAESVEESGLLVPRRLDAQLVASAGLSLVHDSHGYNDEFTPPLVRYDWEAGLHHRSKTKGVATRSARYGQAASDIGGQFGKAIVKLLKDYAEADGLLPNMPAGLYPAYQEPPHFAFLAAADPERVYSWHGLMTSNDTLWRLEPVAEPAGAIADMGQQLEADGWRLSGEPPAESSPAHLRCFKGPAILTVFEVRQRRGLLPGGSGREEPSPLYVRYLNRMSGEAVQEAMEGALTADAPTDLLLVLSRKGSREQRERAMALLEARGSPDPEVWLALAEFHRSMGRKEAGVAALFRAYALTDAVAKPAPLRGKFDRLAKDLGLGPLKPNLITPELLRESGFVELTPGMDPVSVEVGEGEAALFFLQSSDGECATTAARPVRACTPEDTPHYELAYVHTKGGSRSWGQGPDLRDGSPAGCLACMGVDHYGHLTIEKLPGRERFRVTAEVRATRAEATPSPLDSGEN
jgi:hypothetical protein